MPSITIKLKPYLQEFIRSRLNESPSSSLRSIIGATIVPFIERLPKNSKPIIGSGPEYMEIDLVHLDPKYHNDIRGNCYISPDNQQHIARILETHFDDLFFQYIDDKVRYDLLINGKRFNKGQLKLIILQFVSENHIPFNHLQYEMLKKKYYRRKKKEEERRPNIKNIYRSTLLFLV